MTNYNPSHVVLNAIYALKQNIDICSRIYIVVTYLKQKYLIKLSTDVIFKKKIFFLRPHMYMTGVEQII